MPRLGSRVRVSFSAPKQVIFGWPLILKTTLNTTAPDEESASRARVRHIQTQSYMQVGHYCGRLFCCVYPPAALSVMEPRSCNRAQRKNSSCFISCPPEPTISWTEVDFVTVYPRNAVFSWTGAAQSMRSEPFGVARAACFEQLAGHCQLRCPALRKDLCKPEDKERYIPDTSELRSERLYFRIGRLCRCIRRTIIKVVKYRLIVVHELLQNSVKARDPSSCILYHTTLPI